MKQREGNIIWYDFGERKDSGSDPAASRQNRYREDWRRFYVIQLHIYLTGKRSGRIGTEAEGDMIRDLLSVYWEEILASGILEELTLLEKLSLFRNVSIEFPFIEVSVPEGFIPFKG